MNPIDFLTTACVLRYLLESEDHEVFHCALDKDIRVRISEGCIQTLRYGHWCKEGWNFSKPHEWLKYSKPKRIKLICVMYKTGQTSMVVEGSYRHKICLSRSDVYTLLPQFDIEEKEK